MLGGEVVVAEDLLEQRNRRGHAFDHELVEHAAHTGHGIETVLGSDDDLAHHRIELRGDGVALFHTGIDAHAGAGRPLDLLQGAGAGGQVGGRVFAGDAQFEAVAAQFGGAGELATGGDIELFAHQVEAADLFGDGVLHLQARVDFQEVHLAVRGHHEFAGAQAHVADRGEQAAGVFLQRADDFLGQEGRGRLFHEFLVAALQRAVTGGVHGEVAVRVAPGLGLDVACLVHELLDEVFLQIAALQRVVVHVEAAQLLVVMHHGDAVAATAISALHHDRVAVGVCEVEQRSHVGHRFGQARHRRHFGAQGHSAGGDLVAQIHQRGVVRTHPDGTGILDLLCEARHFGKESVAGVHGVRTGLAQDVDQQILVEVRVLVGVAGEQVCLVGHVHIAAIAILFGVDGHGGDTHLLGRAHHAKRNLASVRNQQFFDSMSHSVKLCSPYRGEGKPRSHKSFHALL